MGNSMELTVTNGNVNIEGELAVGSLRWPRAAWQVVMKHPKLDYSLDFAVVVNQWDYGTI